MDAPPVQYTTHERRCEHRLGLGWGRGPCAVVGLAQLRSRMWQDQVLNMRGFLRAAGALLSRDHLRCARHGHVRTRCHRLSAETLLMDAEAVIDAAKIDRFVVEAEMGCCRYRRVFTLQPHFPSE